MKTLYLCISMAALLVLLQACGGASDAKVEPRVQKTAIVEFATATTAPSPGLRYIYIEAILPEGVTVATESDNRISSGVLQGVTGQIKEGTYYAADRKVKIPVINTSQADLTIGPYAKLTCGIMPGFTLDSSQFSSIVPTVFEPLGLNALDLTTAVTSTISVTFGY